MINTNPFLPTTTGGTAGQFVYDELNKSQKRDDDSIALSQYSKYEAIDQERVNKYVTVLKATDQVVLDKLQIINNKKQQIVTIIGDVFNSNLDSILVSNTGSVSDSVAQKVVYMAGISTFNYGTPVGDPPEYKVGVRGQVFPDIFSAWHYPNLESLNSNQVFYQSGESYISIGSTNLGIGVTAYEYGNVAGATGFIGLVTTANSSLGYYYFWPNLSTINAGAATSISNLVTDIETLRVEIQDILFNVENGTNKIRNLKNQSQIDLWFEKKGQSSVNLFDYEGGMDSLEDNANIIQNYNA